MKTLPETNIHWLLNQIDGNAPVTCKTCVYAGTHEKCSECLPDTDPIILDRANWKPGNAVMHLYEHQRDGKSVIVIGGQGEADFYATNSPKRVASHLHSVSAECGYLTGRLIGKAAGIQTLTISTHEGEFLITWDNCILIDIKQKTDIDYIPSRPDADTLEALSNQ